MQTLESGKFVTTRKTSLSINKQIIFLFQRWVWAFRKDRLEVDVNTNNGLERQNEDFKHNPLALLESIHRDAATPFEMDPPEPAPPDFN